MGKYKVEIQESEVIKHLQDENFVDDEGSSIPRMVMVLQALLFH